MLPALLMLACQPHHGITSPHSADREDDTGDTGWSEEDLDALLVEEDLARADTRTAPGDADGAEYVAQQVFAEGEVVVDTSALGELSSDAVLLSVLDDDGAVLSGIVGEFAGEPESVAEAVFEALDVDSSLSWEVVAESAYDQEAVSYTHLTLPTIQPV